MEDAFSFLCQILDVDTIYFNIYNASLSHFKIMYACGRNGFIDEPTEGEAHPTQEAIIKELVKGNTYTIEEIEKEKDAQVYLFYRMLGARSMVFYPVKTNDILIGSVVVMNLHKKLNLDQAFLTVLRTLSKLISETIAKDFGAYKLAMNASIYKNMFQAFVSPFVLLNSDFRIIDVNHAFEELFDLLTYEVIFKDFFMVLDNYENERIIQSFSKVELNNPVNVEIFQLVGGEKKIINLSIFLIIEEENMFYAVMLKDITEEKIYERRLMKMAFYDTPTGLSNRNYFEKTCEEIMNSHYQSMGVLLFDVDNLKVINDQYGHEKGDYLIFKVSTLISECFGSEYLTARLGGDEFIVFVMNKPKSYLIERLHYFKQKVIDHNKENELTILFSSGFAYATYEEHRTIEQLTDEADRMMYQEKRLKHKKIVGTQVLSYYST